MDSRKAKEILTPVRQPLDLVGDPLVDRALEQVRRDPELADWWARQQEADAILSQMFRAIEIPDNLEARILSSQQPAQPIHESSGWWKSFTIPRFAFPLATAAAVIVGLWSLQPRPADFAAYRSEMVAAVSVPYDMDIHAEDFDTLRQAFSKSGWPANYQLTSAVQTMDVEGGLLRTWRGEKVSVLCLEIENMWADKHPTGGASGTEGGVGGSGLVASDGDRHTHQAGQHADEDTHHVFHEEDLYLWLFVVDRSTFPELTETGTAIEQVGDLMTVAWVQGDKAYLLADDGNEESLRAFR